MDRRLHDEMRRMVEQGEAPSLTAAARELARDAWPPTSKNTSKAARLVRTYPHPWP